MSIQMVFQKRQVSMPELVRLQMFLETEPPVPNSVNNLICQIQMLQHT